mmetsp:Transcript_118771/g.222038  ORF Transcript_118771/g.222038 Transcript_118771/m.222038 type:complete len:256 (-) Transcript_118771:666-1433(-)
MAARPKDRVKMRDELRIVNLTQTILIQELEQPLCHILHAERPEEAAELRQGDEAILVQIQSPETIAHVPELQLQLLPDLLHYGSHLFDQGCLLSVLLSAQIPHGLVGAASRCARSPEQSHLRIFYLLKDRSLTFQILEVRPQSLHEAQLVDVAAGIFPELLGEIFEALVGVSPGEVEGPEEVPQFPLRNPPLVFFAKVAGELLCMGELHQGFRANMIQVVNHLWVQDFLTGAHAVSWCWFTRGGVTEVSYILALH